MVYYLIYSTYVHLTRSTIQEETISVKTSFERFSATFGVKINRYHTYNGIFSEKPLGSAIEDSNQTITFCGVGYHHKNPLLKEKLKL